MMKQLRFDNYFLAFLFLGLFSSCEEQTDWNFQSLENGILVVEAIITNELKTQEVLLSISTNDLNDEVLPAVDAEVRLIGGGKTFGFQADLNHPGSYFSTQVFSARLFINYTLEIVWNGKTYLSESQMTPVLPFPKPTFKAVGIDSLSIGEVAPLYLPHEQAMYEINVDWSHLVDSEPARAKLFFYTLKTIDISELFRPDKASVAFPKGSLLTEKKYGLNPEFAAYLRALLMETEWQGGVFDEASGSLPTNISNGALGFFAICAVRSNTFVAE